MTIVRLILVLVFLVVIITEASLVWDASVVSMAPYPSQVSASVEYICHNTASNPIELKQVKTSCSCTSALIPQKIIPPGESGSIIGTIEFGNRVGKQRKRFEVVTSDGKRHNLYLNVDIPKTYELSTKRLVWLSGDYSAQTCQVVNVASVPIKLKSVKSSSSAFNVELKEVVCGFKYNVIVTPSGKSGPNRAVLTITAEAPKGQKPRTYKIYAQVN